MAAPNFSIAISARRTSRWLWAALAALAFGHALTSYVHRGSNYAHIFGLRRLFDLGAEQNFPSMFSATLFVLNALLLFFIYGLRQNGKLLERNGCWLFLGWLFLFLSLDEAVSLHELLTQPARLLPVARELYDVAWLVPYAAGLSILAAYLARWFLSLEWPAQREFTLAAILFLSGAIGLEMLEGRMVARDIGAAHTLRFEFLVAIEDLLEMAGLIRFAESLLRYIQRVGGGGASISIALPATAIRHRSMP